MTRQQLNIMRMEPLLHILVWAAVFAFPLIFLFGGNQEKINWSWGLFHLSTVAFYCGVFYLNYCLLIPRWGIAGSWKKWLVINVIVVFLVCLVMFLWQTAISPGKGDGAGAKPHVFPSLLFSLKDVFSLVVVVCIATSLRFLKQYRLTQEAREEAERKQIEAERGRSEAELKNLRNQLNPHFLLNTLNNIYALIEFDKEKAQDAVAELSRLLRYVLYENQEETVPLYKEVDFIRNYVALMKIRLSQDVRVETTVDVDKESRTPIAPLLFISLIENAFKHGISPVQESFITIRLTETPDYIHAEIVNSYYPKNETDKSGSGIGLGQVQKRLDILYPGRYDWVYGSDPEGKIYRSELKIYKANFVGNGCSGSASDTSKDN